MSQIILHFFSLVVVYGTKVANRMVDRIQCEPTKQQCEVSVFVIIVENVYDHVIGDVW